jgi:hypothetical protein
MNMRHVLKQSRFVGTSELVHPVAPLVLSYYCAPVFNE